TTLCIGIQSFLPPSIFPDSLRNGVKWWSETSSDPWLTIIANNQSLPIWYVTVSIVEFVYQFPWFF
ncbi:hypothetical protein HDU76_011932, partial [Blyttiomyces sp. JEL0837]